MIRARQMAWRSVLALILGFLVFSGLAHGFIDPKFTPVQLVKESQVIFTGTLRAQEEIGYRITVGEVFKGTPPKLEMSLITPKDDAAGGVSGLLSAGGQQEVIVFASPDGKTAHLHVSGQWLKMTDAGGGTWRVEVARQMSGVWAGGTDMLIRLCRYLLTDPKGSVPVSVGIAWMRDKAVLGKVEGTIAGLQAVEIGVDGAPCVFVASDRGDALFRANKDDETFRDVTAESGLDSRSRRFCWMDLDDSGAAQLVSWNGAAIQVWQLHDGKFRAVGKDYPVRGDCMGLAACAIGSREQAILMTTREIPVLLRRDKQGNWRDAPLQEGEAVRTAGSVTCACVVADLDYDGYVDVLQPRSKAGVLWKGGPDGFGSPQIVAITCAEGPACFCLGDFDGDGTLDIFISGPGQNELWVNDGKAGMRPVIASCGSLSYRCPAGAACCIATDLNHDGRTDLGVMYAKAEFSYHFSRGFRCFGEEGELRLPAPENTPRDAGQVGACVWDFNGDGAQDLAVAFADGQVVCYYNDAFDKPMLRVVLKKGQAGPVTFSVWQGGKMAAGMGTFVAGVGAVPVPLRQAGDCEIRYSLPGRAGIVKKVQWPAKTPPAGVEVILE